MNRSKEGQFGSIFLRDKVPEGITFWNCKADKHVIDIIPFFAGPNDPTADEGQVQYVLDLWVHRNVGPRDLVYVCNAYTWNEPCSICEDLKENDYKDDYVDDHKAKHRTVYFVWVHDSPKEEKEGLKIWEIAHYFMQNHLDELAEMPRSGGIVLFSDPDEGKMIGFSRKGTGAMNTTFIGHQFIERDEPIPDEILEQAFPLDTIAKMRPTYEEVESAYKGRKADVQEDTAGQQEESREPVRRRPSPREPEPEQEQQRGQTRQEEAEERFGAGAEEQKCPGGGQFGVDIDRLSECQTCKVWDDCVAEYKGREAKDKEPEPPKEDPPRRRLPRRRDD